MSGKSRRTGHRVTDSVEHHRRWLGLVDTEGPFLPLPVLKATWPTLDPLDADTRTRLRAEHAAWQAEPHSRQQNWVHYVLRTLLGWEDALVRGSDTDLAPLGLEVPEHGVTVVPDFAVVTPGENPKPGNTHLLGMVCPPGTHPTSRIPGEVWSATPADRLARVCRARGVQLGLVTDGRWWTLLRSGAGHTTASATFDAAGWNEATEHEVVRAFVSLLGRRRFFAVPADETLPALFDAGEDSQEQLTETLGVQARQAVELLLAAVGRADTAQRERGEKGLALRDAAEIYEACVTTLMRLVFLLFAEERGMLPSGNPLYAVSYSASRLGQELERRAVRDGEDELEHSFAAWHRLLALFHAVYFGVDHPRLHLYPHDGSLFDTTRYTWFPRDIDDRTVLHILRAVQYVETGTGRARERRKLSFRELDVEQIGYIYERLLEHDGTRAHDVTVGLLGKPGMERTVALSLLEELAENTSGADELADRLAEKFVGTGFGTARATAKRLAPLDSAELAEQQRALLAATRGDRALTDRLLPFARLVRRDLRGLPVVVMPGELVLTDSPLRNNTGAHYTPRSLAQEVVEPALEPLVYRRGPLQTEDRCRWERKTSDEILALRVADIAMGSGAFLVAAARYLGDQLVEAWAREGNERATTAKIAQVVGDADDDPIRVAARRQVIEHCLYGVDINPMAVDMAKISLWLISMDPSKPFTFLDDRLVTGDSLLGITHVDQLRHMHHDPAVGRELHHDLFGWTDSVDAVVEKSADLRRRLVELPLHGEPLAWLEDKRKLLRESHETTAELRQIGDLLVGGMLAGAVDGKKGLERGTVRAAKVSNDLARHGDTETAKAHSRAWLRTDREHIAFPGEPLHWPLVFPEVFENAGFDAVIGNQPYLGGQKLTGTLGRAYREYLIHAIGRGVRGSADLVAYFVLRSHTLLRPGGQTGLIATNTLAQGDTREVGLDQLVEGGVTIRRSVKSAKWPSRSAALEYCAVWTSKTPLGDGVRCLADGVPVTGITPSLDPASRISGKPERLVANSGTAFQGSNILGLGFTMFPETARELIAKDPRNTDVLFPYLNGQDLNSRPDCTPSRWVINFHDWTEDHAKQYPDCYNQVRHLVKPEREKNKDKRRRELWWRFTRPAPELYSAIAGLNRVIAITLVSKTVMPVMVPTGQVFSHALGVFASDDTAMLALLSSGLHYWWAATRASSMRNDLRYTPSDVFDTFPLPEFTDEMRELGDRLDIRRREIMLARQSGLTKTYNLVFDPKITDPDITELRDIHKAIDEATIRAYSWHDLLDQLDHDFHPAGTYTRYTIGPAAQREILDRLLELNHTRHAEEAAKGLHDKKTKRRKTSRRDTGSQSKARGVERDPSSARPSGDPGPL